MAFILGSLVSAPSVYAPQGEPFVFLQEEIEAILLLIADFQDQLDDLHVTWERVTDRPSTLLEMSCLVDQIGKWDGTQWVCTDEITGPSGSTEFVIAITGPSDITERCTVAICNEKIIKEFKITGLPSSTKEYQIPINLIQLGDNIGETGTGTFQIQLQKSSDGVTFSPFFFIAGDGSELIFRSTDHIQAGKDHIIIDPNKTEKFFRLVGNSFAEDDAGSFDNLKFVMSLPLPEGATIIEILPPI